MAGEDLEVAARTVARMPSRLYCELGGLLDGDFAGCVVTDGWFQGYGKGNEEEDIEDSREGGGLLEGRGRTHDTNARDGIFAFCCFSQHDIGFVLGQVMLRLIGCEFCHVD